MAPYSSLFWVTLEIDTHPYFIDGKLRLREGKSLQTDPHALEQQHWGLNQDLLDFYDARGGFNFDQTIP